MALSRNFFIDLNIQITNAEAEIVVILTPILSLGGLTFTTFGGIAFILGIIGLTTAASIGIAAFVVVGSLSAIVVDNEDIYEIAFNVAYAFSVLIFKTFSEVDLVSVELLFEEG